MSYRDDPGQGPGQQLRALEDRVRDLERMKGLVGTVSVGALRIGGFIIDEVGGDLRATSIANPGNTTTILAGP